MARRRIRTGNSMNQIDFDSDLIELFNKLAERAPEAYEAELANAANAVANTAKANIRDKTGKLKASVRIEKRRNKGVVTYKIKAGGTAAPHAHLVEYGHRWISPSGDFIGDIPPHPFLRKGFDMNRDATEAALNRALDNLLN